MKRKYTKGWTKEDARASRRKCYQKFRARQSGNYLANAALRRGRGKAISNIQHFGTLPPKVWIVITPQGSANGNPSSFWVWEADCQDVSRVISDALKARYSGLNTRQARGIANGMPRSSL